MKIYTVEKAQETILQRKPLLDDTYAPLTLERTEAFFGKGVTPPMAVRQIIQSVRQEGDEALRRWSALLDKNQKVAFKIEANEIEAAYQQLPLQLQETMQASAARIRQFHQLQPITSWITDSMGGELGQRFTPIERVGVYVPGGTAPLPSSLLMSVIPAQVAGVKELVVCTPPNPHPAILGAAYLCGVEEIFELGGAQAIAAMAFGTETVQRVDKIVGAGNLFVTLAKQQLFGVVGLDGLAGPTETMVIADDTANPAWVAADLLAQAEHDVQASAILLTTSPALAEQVAQQVTIQTEKLSRKEIINASLAQSGGIVVTETLDQAAMLANAYAAEHLCLSVRDPQGLMAKINNAGGFFLSEHSFEVLGDYIAGPSHVMPTNGSARFNSPLNVLDFVKLSSVIALNAQKAAEISIIAKEFAKTEGLTAHAAAAAIRLEGDA